jgi:glutamate-1-semialdehyde 2,1-aminomutase
MTTWNDWLAVQNGARWGVVPMHAEFLRGVRLLTQQKNVIFIHDEVITGFRVHPGGFQGHCEVRPDLSTFAKVLAGGLPGGCLAGRADLMQALAYDNPLGRKMKHPGTYNGNPLSAAAGIAALAVVADGKPCHAANDVAKRLRAALNELFARKSDWVATIFGTDYPEYEAPAPTTTPSSLQQRFPETRSSSTRTVARVRCTFWRIDGWLGGSTSSAHGDDDTTACPAFANAIDLLRDTD